MKTLLVDLLLLAVAIGLTHASEREQLISAAIQEVLSEEQFSEMTTTQHNKGGPTTASQLLQAFKHASKEAIRQGKARVKFEKMVHKAERNILNAERKQMESKASSQAKAEEIAKVLLHKPGSVLSKQEVARIHQESNCEEFEEMVDCNQFPLSSQIRTITGVCNNMDKPTLGSADTPFRRLIPAQYEDGFNQLRGTMQSEGSSLVSGGPFQPPNPSPRMVSISVIQDVPNNNEDLTHMLMQWGQFMDHDLDLAPAFIEPPCPESGCDITERCVPIRVPTGDPTFGDSSQATVCSPFPRSIPVCDSEAKHGEVRPREQLNELTSFIDASQVYGSAVSISNAVRDRDRNGNPTAFLKTGAKIPENGGDSLPVDTEKLVECMGDQPCFLAGDVRVNEQLSLTVMHTLWMREHNRIARELENSNLGSNPEWVFQTARAIVGAQLQKITFKDYLPILLGDDLIEPYSVYKSDVNPSVPNAFAAAAFRFGHSQIQPFFDRLNESNMPLEIGPLPLVDAFFNPSQYSISGGTDPILRGLLTKPARRVDEFVNDVLTNHLFQTNTSTGMDLASLNIQRGRDHGLPPYLTWKRWAEQECGISSVFDNDLTNVRLLQAYGTLETVDLWVGGLAERRIPGGLLGATFACIFAKTFQAIRDGDRFYYESPGSGFNEDQRNAIESASLSRVICDNSDGIMRIRRDAFNAELEPVDCSSIPSIDLSLWANSVRENCYLRVEVDGRMSGIELSSVSRRRGERERFELTTSSADETVCLPIFCPNPASSGKSGTTRACVFADQNCRVESNRLLTRSRRRRFFSARISSDDIENSNTGAYMDLRSCEMGSAVAATFTCRSDEASIESDEKLLQDLENTLTQIDGSVKSQQVDTAVKVPVDLSSLPEEVREYLEEDDDTEDDESNVQSDEPWKEKTINVLEDLLGTLKNAQKDSAEKKDVTDQELYENLAKFLKETH